MSNSRKKNSKRTGTTSSRTPSVEPAIDGLGETSPSPKQELLEDYIDAHLAATAKLETKIKKLITSLPLSTPIQDSQDGTTTHIVSIVGPSGSRFCVPVATASKPEPRMSSEEKLEEQRLLSEERSIEGFSPKGLKYDTEKPMLAYIPKAALDAEGKAFGYGARKYEAWNYRNGIAISRTVSAALRHIAQFLDGEDIDQESGAHHLGSARANLAMALDTLANHPSLDDRFKGEKK